MRAPITTSAPREVPKPTAGAPSRSPAPIPTAVASTQRSRGSRRELARAWPGTEHGAGREATEGAAAGASTRPATACRRAGDGEGEEAGGPEQPGAQAVAVVEAVVVVEAVAVIVAVMAVSPGPR